MKLGDKDNKNGSEMYGLGVGVVRIVRIVGVVRVVGVVRIVRGS